MFTDMGTGSETDRQAMARSSRQVLEAALQDGSYRGWLVEVAGQVVAGGGVQLVPFPPSPTNPASHRAFVINIYTEPEFRRRGLARQIMEAILAWCRAQGFASVSLHASDDGRALYESLGFKPTNEMRLMLPR